MQFFKPETFFFAFLVLQFIVVMFVVTKYVIDRLVERKFADLHKESYPDAQIVSSGQKVPFFKMSELSFLIIGPSLLAATMVYSLYTVVSPASQDLRSNAAGNSVAQQKIIKVTDSYKVTPQEAAMWQNILNNVPLNPTQVVATASAQGIVKILTSDNSYPYTEVTFTWTGDKTVEPETNITGYYVYLGSKNSEIPFPMNGYDMSVNPQKEGQFVKTNSYTAKDLTKGQTYYLYVQTKTDSKILLQDVGLEQVGYLQYMPAKKLFVYKIQ